MKGLHLIVKDTEDLQTNELRHEHFCPFHPFPTEPVQRHSEIRHHKTSPNTNYSNTSNEAGTWQGGGVFMLIIRSFMWWNTWDMKCNVSTTTRFWTPWASPSHYFDLQSITMNEIYSIHYWNSNEWIPTHKLPSKQICQRLRFTHRHALMWE